jgi:photosystem II stability/assembly factor-like uncharacterized protein
MMPRRSVLPAVLLISLLAPAAPSGQAPRFTDASFQRLAWRNLGPFRTGAWTTAIGVPEAPTKAHLYTFYVGTRNGGVWKTTNNGTTFEPVFDQQASLSIGAIDVAPSDANTVWVGTGESYQARSSYSGDGVYKSADAGKTWANMGLRDSQHISRIIVHPKNPNVVYVAAMGHLFTPNAERGLFVTEDGGKTWRKSLFVDEKTGVIDLVMSRKDPKVLYAATYELTRRAWDLDIGGPGSGIWKTTDGGQRWTRLGGGLPSGRLGRIGIDLCQANPNILYAIVENANTRPPTAQEAKRDAGRPKPSEFVVGNQVFRSDDAGRTWRLTHDPALSIGSKAAYSFNILRVNPGDPDHVIVISDAMPNSSDGGKTWQGTSWPPVGMFTKAFGDFRVVWWDQQNPDRLLVGSDGGFYVSYDRGKTADHYLNLPVGEFYAIDADMETPYNVYGGMQDHDSWRGPSNSWSGEVNVADWVTVGTGDGMHNRVDPTDSRWLYNASQFGDHKRVDQTLRTMTDIMPKRPAGQPPLRWNWNPPIHLSPHNPQIVYTGAQVLLRSLNRGDAWQEISPDLTTNDAAKTFGRGNIQFCTLTTISESPVTAGVIWTGSDDGRVQVTRTHGATWTDVTAAIAKAGGPADRWVSRVFASSHDAGTALVAKNGFRQDDFAPYLFRTTDYGATWTPIAGNLPQQPINVVWQDRLNRNLLFVGTDKGVWVSIDGGGRFVRMKGSMPDVPVHDLLVHPRDRDLVVGTYGRALYITNVSALQQLSEEVLAEDVHLFDPVPRTPLQTSGWGNYDFYGDRFVSTPNEPNGIPVTYYLRDGQERKVSVRVADLSGAPLRTIPGTSQQGLNMVRWDMRDTTGRLQAAGEYLVTLEVDGRTFVKRARILAAAK